MEKPISSRRSFIAKTSLAVVGTTLLTTSTTFANLLKTSYTFEGYQPILEFKNDLRTFIAEKSLKVSGTLYTSETNLQPCANALVEIWHLSPNSKEFNHKGKFITDQNGQYTFYTDFPNRKEGYKPRIFFKITNQEKTDYTELILDTNQAYISHNHWEKNQELKEDLFPSYNLLKKQGEINFNFIIN
jgi:protocatechuate 3,4-dioxygenase beta subunit